MVILLLMAVFVYRTIIQNLNVANSSFLRWGDLTQVDSNVFQCSREAAGPKLITPSTDVIPGPMCGTKIRVYRMSCFSY